MRIFLFIAYVLIIVSGCDQVYDFKIKNEHPSLVIEGQISNVSFNEFKDYLTDGRYFTVKLKMTSNVTNERDPVVRNAGVTLEDDGGNQWLYIESGDSPGVYILYNEDFRAEPGVKYKLNVVLSDGEIYNSEWEQIPDNLPGPMGNIDFDELEIQEFRYAADERIILNTRGINVNVALPPVTGTDPVYYKWGFLATWIYRAPLLRPTNPNYKCWITNPHYLSEYMLHRDYVGGYEKNLFFLAVDGNDRYFDRVSILISQYSMSEKYFTYWKEIQDQKERNGLFDPPPYNLENNLHAENPDLAVYGYFGVVEEQGKRWNFIKSDLSYPVENTWMDACQNRMISRYDPCINCLNKGDYATTEKPTWWDK